MSYPDVTELYWQAIGSGWERPTANASVLVQLPEPVEDKSDILVYGHGPLSGYAEIVDERTARFTATNLRSGQFLEVRMAWPSGLVAGEPSTRLDREAIKREEARFVQETIARAKAAQEDEARQVKIFSRIALAWLVVAHPRPDRLARVLHADLAGGRTGLPVPGRAAILPRAGLEARPRARRAAQEGRRRRSPRGPSPPRSSTWPAGATSRWRTAWSKSAACSGRSPNTRRR